MDSNVKAHKLGCIAREAGNPKRKDVGDTIDRGLILERLLNEAGFSVHVTQQADTPDVQIRCDCKNLFRTREGFKCFKCGKEMKCR